MRLIDADELKKDIFSKSDSMEDPWDTAGVLNLINNAPTVDGYTFKQVKELFDLNVQMADEIENLKRPQGEWKLDSVGVYCSECKKHPDYSSDFCPHCGADMRGGTE